MKPTTFIFDMDGVMIDSEPFWRTAQINLLKDLGHTITEQDCIRYTMGKRIDDVSKTWCDLYSLNIEAKQLEQKILDNVVVNILKDGKAVHGLLDLLHFLKKENYKIGLATSSSWKIIDAVLHKLEVKHFFNEICSADDEAFGKPNPAVYIKAMQKLESKPSECIILEDSVTGMIAAKASMAFTIVLNTEVTAPKFAIADHKCTSLQSVLSYLKTL